MNKLEGALKDIQDFLKEQNVPYMIIGGIGNLVWGGATTDCGYRYHYLYLRYKGT